MGTHADAAQLEVRKDLNKSVIVAEPVLLLATRWQQLRRLGLLCYGEPCQEHMRSGLP